jgi:hypothetical protein
VATSVVRAVWLRRTARDASRPRAERRMGSALRGATRLLACRRPGTSVLERGVRESERLDCWLCRDGRRVGCSWCGEGLLRTRTGFAGDAEPVRGHKPRAGAAERVSVCCGWLAGMSGIRACSISGRRYERSCERRVGIAWRYRSRDCAHVEPRGALPRAETRVDRARYAADTAAQRGAHVGGDIDVPRST